MREYIREPIPEIDAAYRNMARAVDAHLSGDYAAARQGFAAANDPKVWHWLNDVWFDSRKHIVHKKPPGDTREVAASERDPDRAISSALRKEVLKRDGYRCRYCGLPLIDAAVRKTAKALYPTAVPWSGKTTTEQHAGFQVFWLQFDHVVPHSHGGRSDMDNVVASCAACNYGKFYHTLLQLDLSDPRLRPPVPSDHDGLERLRTVGHWRKLRSCEERLPDRECLRALADFAPRFLAPGANLGDGSPAPGSGEDGKLEGGPLLGEFRTTMRQWGWVSSDFDVAKWTGTRAAKSFLVTPGAIASANVDDLLRITTVLMQSGPDPRGSLAKYLDNGILLAVARRAESILLEDKPVTGKLGHYAMP